MSDPFWPMLIKAMLAGWLIALMVWLIPGAGPSRLLLILIVTYVVAISHFSHHHRGLGRSRLQTCSPAPSRRSPI